jgi:hypothetical protein
MENSAARSEQPHRPHIPRPPLCSELTDEGLSSLISLTALTKLDIRRLPNVTDEGKQALRTAIPNLTIDDFP